MRATPEDPGTDFDCLCVHIRFFKALPQLNAESVRSELPDHAHGAAKARRRDCLVRTLTAGKSPKRESGYGFASNWDSLGCSDKIKIDAAHDYDPLSHIDSQVRF